MSKAAATARVALARGDLITAYDITTSAISEGEDDSAVRHQQILALARMGDTERALDLFDLYGLSHSASHHERAVGARLLKDRAVALPEGEARRSALLDAFQAYHSIYREAAIPSPA